MGVYFLREITVFVQQANAIKGKPRSLADFR